MLLLVTGNWHALARLESELKRLAETGGLTCTCKRTEARGRRARTCCPTRSTSSAWTRPASSPACPGFFAGRSIDISEVATRGYAAAHTGAPMFAVQMMINVPARLHVAQLREEFMDYCDSMNLDAILEPVKS